MNNLDLTLLSEGQVWGSYNEERLEVIKEYGKAAQITDLCVLTGCYLYNSFEYTNYEKGRKSWFWIKTKDSNDDIFTITRDGGLKAEFKNSRNGTIRPVLKDSSLFSKISKNMLGNNETCEVEYFKYPQYAVSSTMQCELEKQYNCGSLKKTGKNYTFDSIKCDDYDTKFEPVTYEEYEYQDKNYIRIKANSSFDEFRLSNKVMYKNGDYVWVEVSPVKWLVDKKTGLLISKYGLVSGVRFLDEKIKYNGDFDKTEMKEYLDEYMIHDLAQMTKFDYIQNMIKNNDKQRKNKSNPYGLKFDNVSEEEIIKGAIESGVAVFLHGPSSEGKSARVKQIDPDCVIIYLRNASPESLNGKSVYNQKTGEMIDIKPTWLKKLEEKCEKEPDKFHIVFLDEITNALPSIQGIAFNIVLDREVNGIWKLPDNARIVAAGNDMKDSLAANQLAEPLFNRFAHVYIKTTTESWLKWASENNIHPAIYSYIAYKKDESLRSKYDGEKPNADPRKWEMASKMLYKTNNPEMLRALVGEDITREFVQFCSQQVITLDDVINDNYTNRDIQELNTAERYVTTMGLSQVDDNNLEKVRNFVANLGAEFLAFFDSLWIHGDDTRLERIAKAKLAEVKEGGIRR